MNGIITRKKPSAITYKQNSDKQSEWRTNCQKEATEVEKKQILWEVQQKLLECFLRHTFFSTLRQFVPLCNCVWKGGALKYARAATDFPYLQFVVATLE